MKKYKGILPQLELKYKKGEAKKVKIKSSNDAEEVFREMFNADTLEYSEEVIILLLNKANNTIGWFKVSQGGCSGTVVDPKIIFTVALQSGASSVLIAHNHPSGSSKPSPSDIKITKKLVAGGLLLEIPVLDHLILTESGFTSMADEGYM